MKKILILIVILSMGQIALKAQKFSFGVKVAPMFLFNEVKNTDTLMYKSNGTKVGVGFGPSVKYNVAKNFSVDVGLIFTWQGTKFKEYNYPDSTPEVNKEYTTKMKYVMIPINLEGKFNITRSLGAILDFGATPAINTESLMTINNTLTGTTLDNVKFSGTFFNLYLNAGAGVFFNPTKELTLSLVALYHHGIIDSYYDNDSNNYLKSLELKERFISLNFGLHINF